MWKLENASSRHYEEKAKLLVGSFSEYSVHRSPSMSKLSDSTGLAATCGQKEHSSLKPDHSTAQLGPAPAPAPAFKPGCIQRWNRTFAKFSQSRRRVANTKILTNGQHLLTTLTWVYVYYEVPCSLKPYMDHCIASADRSNIWMYSLCLWFMETCCKHQAAAIRSTNLETLHW